MKDITAQWLRDTANQFAHYTALLSVDPSPATLVKAVINNEARYVAQDPYGGSFQPSPESGLAPSHNDWADEVTGNPCVFFFFMFLFLFYILLLSTLCFLQHIRYFLLSPSFGPLPRSACLSFVSSNSSW
jgi:meiotically up-regulated gene 157 (Mug157) protein